MGEATEEDVVDMVRLYVEEDEERSRQEFPRLWAEPVATGHNRTAVAPIRDIPLIRFNDIKLGKERRYLVKNLLPRVGLSVVWGPPKCGKSFWTFDVVMHVAIVREYRNRPRPAGQRRLLRL
jgi:AAA domain